MSPMVWTNLVILLYFIAWRWSIAKKKKLEISSLRICVCVFLTLLVLGIITLEEMGTVQWGFAPIAMVVLAYVLRGHPPEPRPEPRYIPPVRVDPQPKPRVSFEQNPDLDDRLTRIEEQLNGINSKLGDVAHEVYED